LGKIEIYSQIIDRAELTACNENSSGSK